MAALANDQIDGFIGVPPVGQTAVHQFQAVPLLTNEVGDIQGADRLQGMTMRARAADVERNPDLYAAMVRADVRPLLALIDDPVAAGALLRRTRFEKMDEPIWGATWKSVQKSWGSPYVTADSLAAWFEAGLVDGGNADAAQVSFDEVLDMSFVQDALTAIGWTPQSRG